MDKKTVELGEKKTYEILDKIDIETIFYINYKSKKGNTINDLMKDLSMCDEVETLLKDEPLFCGYLFNFMTSSEFIEYLEKRYDNISVLPIDDYWVHFRKQ